MRKNPSLSRNGASDAEMLELNQQVRASSVRMHHIIFYNSTN
jgi:hypothetical protein